jgi:hypothetical protein
MIGGWHWRGRTALAADWRILPPLAGRRGYSPIMERLQDAHYLISAVDFVPPAALTPCSKPPLVRRFSGRDHMGRVGIGPPGRMEQ